MPFEWITAPGVRIPALVSVMVVTRPEAPSCRKSMVSDPEFMVSELDRFGRSTKTPPVVCGLAMLHVTLPMPHTRFADWGTVAGYVTV